MEEPEEGVKLVVEEKYDNPLDDPQFRCDVCNYSSFKRYMSLNGCKKALERHKATKAHQHNVERAELGLPPERIYHFTNVQRQMTELVDKMTMRIAELESLVKSVADTGSTCDETETNSIVDSVCEPPLQQQYQVETETEPERGLLTQRGRPHLLSPEEVNVLCDYNGEKLSNMRAVRVILTRLLGRLRDTSSGEKYQKNFQFVNRTMNALSLQLERLRDGYDPDEDEIDQISYRLMQIAEHPF